MQDRALQIAMQCAVVVDYVGAPLQTRAFVDLPRSRPHRQNLCWVCSLCAAIRSQLRDTPHRGGGSSSIGMKQASDMQVSDFHYLKIDTEIVRAVQRCCPGLSQAEPI
jgi:hypothetical protein